MHKKKAGKLQTGITFPKQYWLAVNGKPINRSKSITIILQLHVPNSNILIPQSKTKHHINSFFPRAIRLWNELPTEIRDAPTVPAFARGLNTFYAL